MLKDGQKGVILQRDKKSYAIAPHLACGIITPEILERYAAVARKDLEGWPETDIFAHA